ncbi:SGNH hydrolase-type esterase domain-containing protein [Hypoxylon sp. FL0543]|nr:SGNH hydrolase-type esterase domain-containing protein [Hypoxylon sp. FL0543]
MRKSCCSTPATALAALVTLSQLQRVFALPSSAFIEPRQEKKLEWAVVGDSWATGVAYNSSNKFDNEDCYRCTEAWGAQMSQDAVWIDGGQDFKFAACGGTLMQAVEDQLKQAGNPSLIWGMFGGNNVFFGDIARACLFQPIPGGWGKYWDEDPDGEGYCKKNIQKAADYMNNDKDDGFRQEFVDTLDGIFNTAQKQENPQQTFDLYVSSYVRFFVDDTDDCDNWSFAHPWVSAGHPKVVKGLRKVMNEKTDQLNNLQSDIIKNYKIPAPARPNYRIHNVQPTNLFQGHRFCEPGHSFEDQFYRDDVWLWNLQYYDTQSAALAGNPREAQKTDNGVTFMAGSTAKPPSAGMVLSTFPISNGAAPPSTPNPSPQSQSSFGWTARPFHPKWKGHLAMKDLFIQQMKNDKVPGVKGSNAGGSSKPPPPPPPPQETVHCNGLGAKKYANRNDLQDIIQNQFCPMAVKQGVLDKNSGSIYRSYLPGTMEQVGVAISWQPGLDFRPNMGDCVRLLLTRLVDGCDGNDPKNPMNWKGGGRAVKGKVTYEVTPITLRQPPPTSPGGKCDSTYKALFNEYTVWGVGWESIDSGSKLKGQLGGCALLPDTWSFSYGLGSDGREWTAKFRTGVFQKGCVGNAIKSAGGGFSCGGSG